MTSFFMIQSGTTQSRAAVFPENVDEESAEALLEKSTEDDSLEKSPIKYERCACCRRVSIFIFYFLAGPSTIFLNSYLLNDLHFPYAASLSLLGVLTSTVVARILVSLGAVSGDEMSKLTLRSFLIHVTPIGVALAGSLAFGNVVYLHLSVAFIQILKAFSPVILLVMLLISRLEAPRGLLFVCVGLIVFGTVAATSGEMHVTVYGILCMFLSQIFESIKTIYMQLLLSNKNFEAFESLAVFGPSAVLSLSLVAYFTEDFLSAFAVVLENPGLFLLASLSGLAVNLSTSLFIKETSALTLKIASLGRNVGIVLVSACAIPDSQISFEEFTGYCICLLGCLLYQHARSNPEESVPSLASKFCTLPPLKLPQAR